MRTTFPALFVLLLGCAPSVMPAFEKARDHALADPGPPRPDWEPDAVITVSRSLVDYSLERMLAVHGTVETEIAAGPISAVPRLTVESVRLAPARCADCVRVDADIGGQLRVQTPLGAIGVPVSATVDLDAVFAVQKSGRSWTLTLQPRTIHDIRAELAGTDFTPLTRKLSAWLSEALEGTEPLPIADLGSSALPIRALRVRPADPDLILEILTAIPDPVSVLEPDGTPAGGWRLDLATDTLRDLARIASFEAAPLPRNIVAEPTSLSVTGDTFELGLRLWRVRGRGWWRDYAVRGSLEVSGGRIALTPESVEPEDHSPGAGWVDPLAALGQGVILKALERALETSAPAIHKDKGKVLRTVVAIESIEGRGAVVVVTGDLELKDAPKRR